MKKFGKILLIGLGFCLVTAVLGFLTSKPAPAQHVVPVRVVNTPLPTSISNTVRVSGAVNANVTNSVLPISGAVTATIANTPVPVSGTVNANFSNTSSTPLFADTDGPARSGVAASCNAQFTGGQVGCTLATVPNGKILVIEAVACVAQVTAGFDTPYMWLVVASNSVAGGGPYNFVYHLAMQHIATYPGLQDRYAFTSPMIIYAASGSGVGLNGVGPSQPGATKPEMGCTISGHLVNP